MRCIYRTNTPTPSNKVVFYKGSNPPVREGGNFELTGTTDAGDNILTLTDLSTGYSFQADISNMDPSSSNILDVSTYLYAASLISKCKSSFHVNVIPPKEQKAESEKGCANGCHKCSCQSSTNPYSTNDNTPTPQDLPILSTTLVMGIDPAETCVSTETHLENDCEHSTDLGDCPPELTKEELQAIRKIITLFPKEVQDCILPFSMPEPPPTVAVMTYKGGFLKRLMSTLII